jgi:hypothetical protein
MRRSIAQLNRCWNRSGPTSECPHRPAAGWNRWAGGVAELRLPPPSEKLTRAPAPENWRAIESSSANAAVHRIPLEAHAPRSMPPPVSPSREWLYL